MKICIPKEYLIEGSQNSEESYKKDLMRGLLEGLQRLIEQAQKEDKGMGYLGISLPNKITYPELTDFLAYLRIPVKEGFDFRRYLEKAGAKEIIDESSSRNIRYIADGLIVQYSWPRKDVIEFIGKSESEDEFKLKIDRLEKLANNFYKELGRERLIKQFD